MIIDDIARLSRSDEGVEIMMSTGADYPAFMSWLNACFHEGSSTSTRAPVRRSR
jgi:hypothetical protein